MVAPDDDGGTHLATGHQVVEGGASLRALAVPEPADPRRQALERHARLRHPDPALERGVVGKEVEDRAVGPEDVLGVAGERRPAERALALAEERPDELRHEPREVEGVRDARVLGLRADVVAVVEGDGAGLLEREHRPDVVRHGGHGPANVVVGIRAAEHGRLLDGHAGGDVAVQGVVRGGLVRDRVEPLAAPDQLRLDLGSIADERDGERLAGGGRCPCPAERLVERVRHPVHVADLEAASGACFVHLDHQGDALVHGDREGLCAAHPAQARGEHDAAAERAAEVLPRQFRERLERALEDPLRTDVNPRPGCHLPVHRQALALEVAEDVPGRPLADEVAVRDQDPRRPLVCPQHAHWLAGLDQQGLVVRQPAQLVHDRVERLPTARCAAGSAVDDEVIGALRDLGIEVVHEHPERGFLAPAAATQRGTARGTNGPRTRDRAHAAIVLLAVITAEGQRSREPGGEGASSAERARALRPQGDSVAISSSPNFASPRSAIDTSNPVPPIRTW